MLVFKVGGSVGLWLGLGVVQAVQLCATCLVPLFRRKTRKESIKVANQIPLLPVLVHLSQSFRASLSFFVLPTIIPSLRWIRQVRGKKLVILGLCPKKGGGRSRSPNFFVSFGDHFFVLKNIQKCYEIHDIIIYNDGRCFIRPFLDAMIPKRLSGYWIPLMRFVSIFSTRILLMFNQSKVFFVYRRGKHSIVMFFKL